MASENVTTKFKVDISDLKKNITEANKQVKLYRAELANASAGMQKGEETAESLTKKIEAQSKIVEAEKTKLQALKDELAKYESKLEEGHGIIADLTEKHRQAAEAYGENSDEAKKYAEQLKKAQEAQERNETAADNLRVKIVNQDTAVKNAEGQVTQYSDALDNLGEEENNVGDEAQKATDGGLQAFAVALGNLATKVITGVIDKLKDMAQATVDAYKEFDKGRDSLIKATGASGAAADDLTQTYANVAKQVAGDMDSIGAAVGEVNTRFGYTGEKLEKATVKFERFADITGTDAVKAVQLVSRAMGDAGIDADQYAEVLDQIAVAAQASGISVDTLTEYLTKYGAPMRALGFETKEAIALFSQWEKSGVNTEIAFSGMKAAIGNWSKEGKDAREEFKKTLTEIKNAPSIAEATTKAIKTFGQKAGPDLADAIQGGRFEYQDFLDIIENSAGTVDTTFSETQSVLDKVDVSMQNIKITAAEAFASILDMFSPEIMEAISMFNGIVKDVGKGIKDFIENIKNNGGGIGGIFKTIVESAADFVGSIQEKLADVLPGIMEELMGELPEILSVIIQLATKVAEKLPEIVKNLVQYLPPIISGIAQFITDQAPIIIQAVMDIITGLIQALPDVLQKIVEVIPKIIEGITAVLPKLLGGIATALVNSQKPLVDGIIKLVTAIAKMLPDIIKPIIKTLPELFTTITGTVIQLLPMLIQSLGDLIQQIIAALPGILQVLWDSLGEILDPVAQIMADLWLKIEPPLKKIFGKIKDTINAAIKVVNKIPGVDIPLIGGEEVPQMARGGIVSRPTIAQIGEAGREAVIPLEHNTAGIRGIAQAIAAQMGGTAAASGSTSVNLTQNISSPKALSQYEIWRQTRNLLQLVKAQGV